MSEGAWQDGALYNEKDEYCLARIRYCVEQSVELDGFPRLTGVFTLCEELCPLHTGMAWLHLSDGSRWLVRVLRVTRPRGDGQFEVIEPLSLQP